MPVMFAPAQADDWFSATEGGAREMIAVAGAKGLCYHKVDPAVGKVANDSAALIETYDPDAKTHPLLALSGSGA